MTNISIYKAFERMWLHITQKFATNESVDILQDEITNKANNEHTHTINEIDDLQSSLDAKVPNTRTINGKLLSEDIILSASDIGLDDAIDFSSYATIEYVDNIVGDIETILSTI